MAEPSSWGPSGENGICSNRDDSKLKSRSGHPSSMPNLPPPRTGTPTTDMDGRKELVDIRSVSGIAAGAAQATFAQWTSILLMVSLIFGGCCANVYALEAIIKDQPSSGPLITFVQFILTALFVLPDFVSTAAGFRSLFIKRRSIPLNSWFIYTAFFVTVNLLNNWAFAYRISVPLHIILRSGGPVASIAVGYLYAGKRYARGQMLAVLLLTLGVVTSALADAQAKGQSIHVGVGPNSSISSTFIGFGILALAMFLSAFQGIYADRLYETYGRNHWKEALFYSHTLSLPLFLPTFPQISSQWRELASSPSLLSHLMALVGSAEHSHTSVGGPIDSSGGVCAISFSSPIKFLLQLLVGCQDYAFFQSLLSKIPVRVFYLILNALTQYWCIRGVHLLSAKSSSLTVTVVLNVRKLVSLLLSIQLFGNALSHGVVAGAVLVFMGGAMYGFESARLRRAAPKRD